MTKNREAWSPVSKTRRKKEMHALQRLGERLVRLPQSQLDMVNIPDKQLYQAIMLAKKIKARGGLRRQMQRIGKLMRDVDIEPIKLALAQIDGQTLASVAHLHRLENARDILTTKGDRAIAEIIHRWPTAEPKKLREWIKQLNSAKKQGCQKQHIRNLFRYLSELESATNLDKTS